MIFANTVPTSLSVEIQKAEEIEKDLYCLLESGHIIATCPHCSLPLSEKELDDSHCDSCDAEFHFEFVNFKINDNLNS